MSDAERTALYRMYDAEGVLLYVGISRSFGRRWTQHAAKRPWWPEVHRQTVDWCNSRHEAATRETAAIKIQKPRYNVMHAGDPAPVVVGEKVELLRPGWGASCGFISLVSGETYYIDPDDGRNHNYVFGFGAAEIGRLELPPPLRSADDQSRLPKCGGKNKCKFCRRVMT